MKTTEQKNGHDVLLGGTTLEVAFRDGSTATVFVREITPQDILDGQYVELLRTDYPGLLEFLCEQRETRPRDPDTDLDSGDPTRELLPGWPQELERRSWTALREAEEALNFDFALAEIKAAHARGQALKFIDESIVKQSAAMVQMLDSFGLSRNTAGSPGPRGPMPAPNPSAGSKP